MKMVINNIQVAVMFVEPLGFDFDFGDVSSYIRKNMLLFKGNNPFTIPSNNDNPLPLEIPRFTYQNNNGQLSMSALRIDLLSNSSDKKNINDFIETVNNIINNFNIENNYRIGIVANCSASKESLLEELNSLIKFEYADESPEIQFSYLQNEEIDILKLNIWRRYFYNASQPNSNIIIDINNSAETPLNRSNFTSGNLIIKKWEDIINEVS